MHAKPDCFLEFDNYKDVLRSLISANKHIRGFQTILAKNAGCQRSYLSRVLNEDVHLGQEHMLNIADFAQFDETETELLMLLNALAKAGNEKLRMRLLDKVDKLRKKAQNITPKLRKLEVSENQVAFQYYSHWSYSAIHILTSIPEFQTEEALANHLELSKEIVLQVLSWLNENALVHKTDECWVARPQSIHVSNDNPAMWSYMQSWGTKAIEDLVQKNDSLHYTGVHSLSRADARKIKNSLLRQIEEANHQIKDSIEEVAVCMKCDFFLI